MATMGQLWNKSLSGFQELRMERSIKRGHGRSHRIRPRGGLDEEMGFQLKGAGYRRTHRYPPPPQGGVD